MEIRATKQGYRKMAGKTALSLVIMLALIFIGLMVGGYIGAALFGGGIGGAIASVIILFAQLSLGGKAEAMSPLVALTPQGVDILLPVSEMSFKVSKERRQLEWKNIRRIWGDKRGIFFDLVDPQALFDSTDKKQSKHLRQYADKKQPGEIFLPVGAAEVTGEQAAQQMNTYRYDLEQRVATQE